MNPWRLPTFTGGDGKGPVQGGRGLSQALQKARCPRWLPRRPEAQSRATSFWGRGYGNQARVHICIPSPSAVSE